MKLRILSLSVLLALAACATPPAPKSGRLAAEELSALSGTGWTGSLTYRDYSPPFGEVTIAAALTVTETPHGLMFAYAYPKEPQANSESSFFLSPDGTVLDDAPIISVNRTPDALLVRTQRACEDDNQPATCTYDYSIARRSFEIRKSVTFAEPATGFVRHTYTFSRL